MKPGTDTFLGPAGVDANQPAEDIITSTPPPGPEPVPWSPDRRKSAVASSVAAAVGAGWNVQSQTDYQAVMIRPGTKVNHLLHLILTLITLGLWLVVWFLVAVLHKREKLLVISVDEYGNTTRQG